MRRAGRVITALAVAWLALLSLAAMLSSWLPLPDPLSIDLAAALSPPTPGHWLGFWRVSLPPRAPRCSSRSAPRF
jgi:hypothetical protein